MADRPNTYFSPSEYHRYLLANIKPSLHYSGDSFPQWRRRLRNQLWRLLGDFPKARVPLNPQLVWRKKHPLGSIEKLVFRSEPHCDVPVYFCIPKDAQKPFPTMICLQGHTSGMHNSIAADREDEQKEIEVEGDRDFAIGCMKRGIAALCIEQRSFGERSELKQKSRSELKCHDAVMHSLMLGKTLLGERVFDVDRGLDYLESRSDIDMGKVGVMGNSGGGTTSLFAGALLSRIRFALVSSYFCTFSDSLMAIKHCGDNYVPGLLKVAEMSDVAGLIAPKPLLIVHGKEDPIFPIKGTRKAFRETKRIYQAAGASDSVQLVVGNGGHRFFADLAWKRFIRNFAN